MALRSAIPAWSAHAVTCPIHRSMLSQLLSDLRELSQEARKKEAELKEASENATLLVRSLAEKTKDLNQQLQLLSAMDDVLKPFLLGLPLAASAPKIGLLSISGLNKLVSYHSIHESKLSQVVLAISQPIDTGLISDMAFLLKVLQTVVALLTPPSPPLHQDDLARALGVCFKLRASKVPGLHQPAEASLRQIFSTIMDRTWELYSAKMASATPDTQQGSSPALGAVSSSSVVPPSDSPQSSQQSPSSTSTGSIPLVSQPTTSSGSGEKPKTSECDRSILDATRLLRDIVYLAAGAQPIWLSLPSLDTNFCLELLEEFLTSHRQLALQCPEFTAIVKDRISSLLLQLLEQRKDIGYMIRLLRSCVAFITAFHMLQPMHCVTILGAFRGLLVPTQPFWLQILLLETFRWLCKDHTSLLSKIVLEDDGLLRDKPQLLESFIKLIGKLGRFVTTVVAKMETTDFVVKTVKPRFIDQLTYLDISSQMSNPHAVTFSLSSFVSLIDTMALLSVPFDQNSKSQPALSSSLSSSTPSLPLVNPASDTLADASTTPQAQQLDSIFKVNQRICDSSWPSVLASLSVILSKTRDESLIQSCLKAYQSFTNTLGVLQLRGPRGVFLDSLIKFSLPFNLVSTLPVLQQAVQHSPSSTPPITLHSTPEPAPPIPVSFTLLSEDEYKNCKFTKKNIAAMKTVLNIAHCMGSILDTNWPMMVDCLNHLNGILACTRRVRNVGVVTSGSFSISSSNSSLGMGPGSEDEMDSPTPSKPRNNAGNISQYDLNTQDAATAAQEWPTREEIDILDSALDSLFSTSVYISDDGLVDFANALIQLSTAQLAAITDTVNVKLFALFGISALFKLLRHNLARAPLLWTDVHKYVLFACNGPNQASRQLTLRGICGVVEEGVAAITKPPFDSLPKDSPGYVAMMLMQVRFLETIEALIESRHDHVRVEVLEALHRILQNSGSALSSGWPVVLSILLNIGVSNEIALIPLGFKSVQAITNEYLSALPCECLAVTISTIGNFGGKSIADININIAAIGLLWNVADFIARKQGDILQEVQRSQGLGTDIAEDSSTDQSGATPPQSLDGSMSSSFRADDPNFSAGSGGLFKGQTTYVDSLWLALFQELAARVDNVRSEIRDCALATLYGILTTYGSSLNLPAWQNLLDKLLLPSLPWVLKQVEIAMTAPDGPEVQQSLTSTTNLLQHTNSRGAGDRGTNTGATNTGNVAMNNSHSSPHLSQSSASPANIAVHHSRNTLAKQWQETQISLMSNMSRVFKAFLVSALVKLPLQIFERFYTSFLDHAEAFARSPSLEVSQQAVSAVKDLLIATYGFVPDVHKSVAMPSASSGSLVPDPSTPTSASPPPAASGNTSDTPAPVPFTERSLPPECAQLESYAWRAWQRIATHIGKVKQQPRLVGYFVEAIEDVFAVLSKKHCSTLHIERLVSVLGPLLFVPLELAGEYTVLHKQLFPLLASLTLPSGIHARHALSILPQIVSLCLTYVSNAIGMRYVPACYEPRHPALLHQLDLPRLNSVSLPSTPSKSPQNTAAHTIVVDRGSWNVSQASLEKNFFNLSEKSVHLLQSIWEALETKEYASALPYQFILSSFASTELTRISLDPQHQDVVLGAADPMRVFNQSELEDLCQRLALQVFPDIVSVLGHAIQVKHLDARAKFWLPSLELFTRSARETLPQLSAISSSTSLSPQAASEGTSPTNQEGPVANSLQRDLPVEAHEFSNIETNIIWTEIIDSIESFLTLGTSEARGSHSTSSFSSHGKTASHHLMSSSSGSHMPSSSGADMIATQASEARLIELLSHHLLYICPDLPNLHERLFQILTDGCDMVHREALMKQCYAGLLDAVDVRTVLQTESDASTTPSAPTQIKVRHIDRFKTKENRLRVARFALPQLMSRCRVVLTKFVADDKRSGALPLPAARVVELCYLLDQLKSLHVDRNIWDKPPKVDSLASSERRHLWELFPLLCECITAKESEVKSIIKSIFHECGQELGLE